MGRDGSSVAEVEVADVRAGRRSSKSYLHLDHKLSDPNSPIWESTSLIHPTLVKELRRMIV